MVSVVLLISHLAGLLHNGSRCGVLLICDGVRNPGLIFQFLFVFDPGPDPDFIVLCPGPDFINFETGPVSGLYPCSLGSDCFSGVWI